MFQPLEDDRLAIQTAFLFKISYVESQKKLNVTKDQISYVESFLKACWCNDLMIR